MARSWGRRMVRWQERRDKRRKEMMKVSGEGRQEGRNKEGKK